jgi:hypothetical protein
MCFASKPSSRAGGGSDQPGMTPTTPNPNNAPAANQTTSQPRPISSTSSADPLGQSQLGS